MMYQSQPMGMGYSQPSYYGGRGGYSQPQLPVGSMQSMPATDKAPVLCNCCNCKHNTCAKFWVIYNAVQLVLCYCSLILEALIGLPVQNQNSTATTTTERGEQPQPINLQYPVSKELIECAGKTREDSIKNTSMSILIVLLVIYTFGSILYSVAVFAKNMDVRKRSLFLIIYVATIACFPLAYFIPLIIHLSICGWVVLELLRYVWWWYLIIVISTALACNISIVFRRWIMKPNIAIMPESQQQIIAQQSDISYHANSGKDEDEDSDSDDDDETGVNYLKSNI